MVWRWRHTSQKHTVHTVDSWITREFTRRGLTPPHCTPKALAQALERERQITIEFQPHVSDDPGVYGLVYRREGEKHTYIVLFRANPSIVLRRLILFHELAHLVFDHVFVDVGNACALCGYRVSEAAEAEAEAFAVGAMQYSFMDAEAPRQRTDVDDDVPSAFGQLLQKTALWP